MTFIVKEVGFMVYTKEYWEDIKAVCRRIPQALKLKGKRIFITGAGGLICSTVAEILMYLNKSESYGMEIILGGRSEERLKNRYGDSSDYKFVQYDATKENVLDFSVDYIIHGASNADPVAFDKQPVDTVLANIVGTKSLLDMAVKNNARLLYISSSEVYGKVEGNGEISETDYGFLDILDPRNCYPTAKRTAENLCVCYGKQYGCDTVTVRPGYIYGPTITATDTRATAQFTRNAVSGEDIVMKSSGMQKRSYCYTLDCASAILAVLTAGESSNAYNISNKDSIVTIRGAAQAFAVAGNAELVFENPADKDVQPDSAVKNTILSSDKLEALGWNAMFDMNAGARRTVEMLKKI